MNNRISKIRAIIARHRKLIEDTYKVKSIGIFGSYVRGNVFKHSDIDILIEFKESPDIFRFLELENYFGKLLGKNVDLVTPAALKPLIKDQILKDTIYL